MSRQKAPSFFHSLEQSHPDFIDAVDRLGQTVREQGPLDNKTAHLVQLAAAAAIRSRGRFTATRAGHWRREPASKRPVIR